MPLTLDRLTLEGVLANELVREVPRRPRIWAVNLHNTESQQDIFAYGYTQAAAVTAGCYLIYGFRLPCMYSVLHSRLEMLHDRNWLVWNSISYPMNQPIMRIKLRSYWAANGISPYRELVG